MAFTLDTYAHVMPGMQADVADRFSDLVFTDEAHRLDRPGPDQDQQL